MFHTDFVIGQNRANTVSQLVQRTTCCGHSVIAVISLTGWVSSATGHALDICGGDCGVCHCGAVSCMAIRFHIRHFRLYEITMNLKCRHW